MEVHTSREIVLESACPSWESSIEWPQLTTHKLMVKWKLQISNSRVFLTRPLKREVKIGQKSWTNHYGHIGRHMTLIGMTPYQSVYGKSCHLPLELEHEAYWAIKEMNLDVYAARIKWRIQISELEEMRLKAYESATM
jgi:hypothetical protein